MFYNFISVSIWQVFATSIHTTICYYCMPMFHTRYFPFFWGSSFDTSPTSSMIFNNFNLLWKCFPPIYGGGSIIAINRMSMVFWKGAKSCICFTDLNRCWKKVDDSMQWIMSFLLAFVNWTNLERWFYFNMIKKKLVKVHLKNLLPNICDIWMASFLRLLPQDAPTPHQTQYLTQNQINKNMLHQR